jgi:quercetin dioxygenase-like cupin family protein
MTSQVYSFKRSDSKLIERVLEDENVGINHMILAKGDALPEHYSNSNVYMIVIRGTISLNLNDKEVGDYKSGSIVSIPYKTKMNVSNRQDELLEFFVVKAPSPKHMQGR